MAVRAAAFEGTTRFVITGPGSGRQSTRRVEPVGFSTDREGRMVVSVHQVVRDLDGRVLSDGMVAHVYRIEDGLIRSMEIRKV
jgi:hypothetical protein